MNLPEKLDLEEIKKFVDQCSPTTKLYIGCDSERFKKAGKWYADFITVVVVHIDGSRGCRLFGAVKREPDYDKNKHRPAIRLMTEAYKVAALYIELAKVIDRPIEVHLDINPDVEHGSSCVVDQAVGYVRGVCGVVPKIKNEAFAASYAADRYKEIVQVERAKSEVH